MNKVLIAIKSCWQNKERRDACRRTWINDLGEWADYKFFVGRHKPLKYYGDVCESLYGESDVHSFNVDDGFKNIAPKIKCIMGWALDHKYETVVVVDDDTYLRPERLENFVQDSLSADYIGFERQGSQHYMQGACYIVSEHAMWGLSKGRKLVEGIADDVAVGVELDWVHEYTWQHSNRFWPGAEPRRITVSNDLISTHKCAIAHNRHNTSMDEIHQAWLDSVQRHSIVNTGLAAAEECL